MREHDGYLSRWRWVWKGRRSVPQKCCYIITMSRARELVLNSAKRGEDAQSGEAGSDTTAEKGTLAQSVQRHEIIQSRAGLGKALLDFI